MSPSSKEIIQYNRGEGGGAGGGVDTWSSQPIKKLISYKLLILRNEIIIEIHNDLLYMSLS